MEDPVEVQPGEDTERAFFESRRADIRRILEIPEVKPLFEFLPQEPKLIDLFSGTGAGAGASFDVSVTAGKKPKQVVTVDIYEQHSPEILRKAKYALDANETSRNLSSLDTDVQVMNENVAEYIRHLTSDGQRLPFDLVTGFSVPFGTVYSRGLDWTEILEAIDPNSIGLMTFSDHSLDFTRVILSRMKERKLDEKWGFYITPKGAHAPNYDLAILTNRNLNLQKLWK
ncbi:MAG: hypothetical protein Q7S79_02600 [bacterium]|nr:hypothetical protein [bacterium]